MATELNSAEREFIRRMVHDGPEFKRRGFEVLQARSNLEKYFQPLLDNGLFEPAQDPKPEKVGRGWRFENWAALAYLKALAKKVAKEPGFNDIGEKIVAIVRAVDVAPVQQEGPPRNFFTLMAAVEVLSELPQKLTTAADADMAGKWLVGGHGLAPDLCDWLKTLLVDKPDANVVAKALALLKALVGATTNDSDGSDGVVYWLGELIGKRGNEIGRLLKAPALDLLKAKLVELVEEEGDKLSSVFTRPAIEDHQQNTYRSASAATIIGGLRDGLLGWIDTGAGDAPAYVKTMLGDNAAILRRIALYCIDERFELLKPLLIERIDPDLFQVAHRHELHRLLAHHFAHMSDEAKAKVLEVIKGIEIADDEDRRYTRYEQARWLSACTGQGVAAADELMDATLNADPPIKVPEHPDFDLYSESWSGSGPSPYTLQEILGWDESQLLEKLQGFVDNNTWRGPTRRSLSDTFAEAIRQRPTQFLGMAKTLEALPWTYRYSVINGFTDLARTENESSSSEQPWWDKAWPTLIELAEKWTRDPELLQAREKGGDMFMTPNQEWIPNALARLIEEGARKDGRGFPASLFTRARAILIWLLHELPPAGKTDWTDALSFAINTPRGRVLEALMRLTLKEARAEDRGTAKHDQAWAQVKAVFDEEVDRAKSANYEFSAIAGLYLPQLHYLSSEWVEGNIRSLIPLVDHPKNAKAFLDGLAYVQIHRPLYQLLKRSGLVTELLSNLPSEKQPRERFLHSIGLAYLWGDEDLDGRHLQMLLEPERRDFLGEFLDLFRQVVAQVETERRIRVRALVAKVQASLGDLAGAPPALLSVLIGLIPYQDKLDDGQVEFLLKAIPLSKGSQSIFLAPELNRLLQSNPKGVAVVARKMIVEPYFHDYNNQLREMIRTLHAKGFVTEAMFLLDELRHNQDFVKLAAELDQTA